jgi:ABC-type dipeptide/oligopeptide/nickel transport system permease subunit
MVAIAAAMVSLIVGIAWGATAGWIGGRVDEAMMRIVDRLPFWLICFGLGGLAIVGGGVVSVIT